MIFRKILNIKRRFRYIAWYLKLVTWRPLNMCVSVGSNIQYIANNMHTVLFCLYFMLFYYSSYGMNDVIKWKYFSRYWPFVRETTDHRCSGSSHPHTRSPPPPPPPPTHTHTHTQASDAERWCFLWSAPEQTVEHTIETSVVSDGIALIMTSA